MKRNKSGLSNLFPEDRDRLIKGFQKFLFDIFSRKCPAVPALWLLVSPVKSSLPLLTSLNIFFVLQSAFYVNSGAISH